MFGVALGMSAIMAFVGLWYARRFLSDQPSATAERSD